MLQIDTPEEQEKQPRYMFNINDDNIEQFRALNDRLQKIQDEVIPIAINLDRELAAELEDKNDWLEDYDIYIELTFNLSENDKEFDEDDDNILLVLVEYMRGSSKGLFNSGKDKRWTHNHNINKGRSSFSKHWYNDWHCWWYHWLVDLSHLGNRKEDLLRLGDIWASIEVSRKYSDEE